MIEHDFNHLWKLQETFYAERPLMWAQNQNVLSLLDRIKDEATECQEEITICMQNATLEQCVDLMSENIRQEVADLLLFVMGLARCIGLDAYQLILDAITKVARNESRYIAADYKDMTANFDDKAANSRSWDKRRGFSHQFYEPTTVFQASPTP